MSMEEISFQEIEANNSLSNDGNSRVVLVVDDEPIIADTLVVILKSAGYDAVAAYDGVSALEIALVTNPDLLITDVVMPRMNGIDLAIAVKDAIPDCRILLFSGQAATKNLLAEANSRGHDFTLLSKPIHPHDLLAHASRLFCGYAENLKSCA